MREGNFWGSFCFKYSVINEIPLNLSASLSYYISIYPVVKGFYLLLYLVYILFYYLLLILLYLFTLLYLLYFYSLQDFMWFTKISWMKWQYLPRFHFHWKQQSSWVTCITVGCTGLDKNGLESTCLLLSGNWRQICFRLFLFVWMHGK